VERFGRFEPATVLAARGFVSDGTCTESVVGLLEFGSMLLRFPAAFDDPNCLFEPKQDGFALANIEGHRCQFVPRWRHRYRQCPQLAEELAHSVRADAVLDGEIVCLVSDGGSKFHNLPFRRHWLFVALDALSIDGEDLRGSPLEEHKRRLKTVMPRMDIRLYIDHVDGRGDDLLREVCRRDLEGTVEKWRVGRYHSTTWFKAKDPAYSQGVDGADLFAPRRWMTAPSRAGSPVRSPELSR
jgi:ATP-dependent DNA ligase